MAALVLLTPGLVAPTFLHQCRIRTQLVGPAGVAAGQGICVDPVAGKVAPANTATAGHEQFRGIALETFGPGQGVDVLEEGFIAGYDLSAVPYDALIYVQDSDGVLGTTPGTKTVPVGRVVSLSDRDSMGNPSKLLYIRSTATQNF